MNTLGYSFGCVASCEGVCCLVVHLFIFSNGNVDLTVSTRSCAQHVIVHEGVVCEEEGGGDCCLMMRVMVVKYDHH